MNEHSGQTYGDSAEDREGKDLTCGQESVVTDDGIAEKRGASWGPFSTATYLGQIT